MNDDRTNESIKLLSEQLDILYSRSFRQVKMTHELMRQVTMYSTLVGLLCLANILIFAGFVFCN